MRVGYIECFYLLVDVFKLLFLGLKLASWEQIFAKNVCVGSQNVAKIGEIWLKNTKNGSKNVGGSRSGAEEKLEMVGFRNFKNVLEKGFLRATHVRTTFQCECPHAEPFYLLRRGLSASYFLFVRVGTNRLVGRLAETYIDQSLYTRVNGSLRFPLFSQVIGNVKVGSFTNPMKF